MLPVPWAATDNSKVYNSSVLIKVDFDRSKHLTQKKTNVSEFIAMFYSDMHFEEFIPYY